MLAAGRFCGAATFCVAATLGLTLVTTSAGEALAGEPPSPLRSTAAAYRIDPGSGGAPIGGSDGDSSSEHGEYIGASDVLDSSGGVSAEASASQDRRLTAWTGQSLSGDGAGEVAITGGSGGAEGGEAHLNASSTVLFPFQVMEPVIYDFDATLRAGKDSTGSVEVSSLSRASLCEEGGGCAFFEVVLAGPEVLSISGELAEGDYLLTLDAFAELDVDAAGIASADASYDFDFSVVPEPRTVPLELAALATLSILVIARNRVQTPRN